jgi:hypothetical protein
VTKFNIIFFYSLTILISVFLPKLFKILKLKTMSKTPFYFIKKPTASDLGDKDGVLYKTACYFSLKGRPTQEFYFTINPLDLPQAADDKKVFSFLYERPNNLVSVNINLRVRLKGGTFVFELAMSPFAKEIGIEFGEIFVIEQKAPEQFAIKIMKTNHPNYEMTNESLNNGNVQLCTRINPFD